MGAVQSEGYQAQDKRFKIRIEPPRVPAWVTPAGISAEETIKWNSYIQSGDEAPIRNEKARLAHVQGVCEKWSGTLGSIIGVSVVLGLLQNTADIARLAPFPENFVLALVVMSLIAAVAAVWLSARASFGYSIEQGYRTVENVSNYFRRSPYLMARDLWFSRIFTVIALAMFSGALIVTWKGEKEHLRQNYLVVVGSEYSLCGQLVRGDAGHIAVDVPASSPIPLRGDMSIVAIDECPSD